MKILEALCQNDLVELSLVTATPRALRDMLKKRKEVLEVAFALKEEALTEDDIKLFVSALLRGFKPLKKFSGDIALSALAVALETIPRSFAESFLKDLSALHIQELPMSPRVALLVLRNRHRFLSGTTYSGFTISQPVPSFYQLRELRPTPLYISVLERTYRINP